MATIPKTVLETAVSVPRHFTIDQVPFQPGEVPTTPPAKAPDLGPLKAFTGDFVGQGFNTIFRPQNSTTPTKLPVPQPTSDNILELNLTVESLSFGEPLGEVPNRGERQGDVVLGGMPYMQTISDVTDPKTITPIHLEPGLWVTVPATTVPAVGATLVRMASIPHGTTINAQGTFTRSKGAPTFDKIDITPFPIGNPNNRIPFASQKVVNSTTPRIPQDLAVAPKITQALLDNPNSLLAQHNAGLTITTTDTIRISTKSSAVPGGGTDNIGFLIGDASGPNADAAEMSAIFWIETVRAVVSVPPIAAGTSKIVRLGPVSGPPRPILRVTSTGGTTATKKVTVTYTQIQYTQNVSLNFATLTWPHVSVATLVPKAPLAVAI